MSNHMFFPGHRQPLYLSHFQHVKEHIDGLLKALMEEKSLTDIIKRYLKRSVRCQ